MYATLTGTCVSFSLFLYLFQLIHLTDLLHTDFQVFVGMHPLNVCALTALSTMLTYA